MPAILILAVQKSKAQGAREFEIIQEKQTINLAQAIKVALANNNQIKQSLVQLKIAGQRVRRAFSNVYPEIEATASYTRNLELPVFFFPANPGDPDSPLRPITIGADNNWRAGLTVTQTIFDGDVFVGITASEVFKAVREEGLRATSQQIVTQTRLAYYNVLIAQAQLRLAKESLQRLLENLDVNEARFRAGLIDEYSVLQVRVQVSNQRPEVTAAEYGVQQAYRELKMVMGIRVNYPLQIKGNLRAYDVMQEVASVESNQNLKLVNEITPYRAYTDTALIAVAKNYRGDIRVLQKRNQFKAKEVKAVKARFLPTLSASYNLNYVAQEPAAPNFFGTVENRVRTQAVMLTLTVPIFDGFSRSADVQITQLEKRDLELQKRIAVRDAKNEIETALENLKQAIDTAPAREKAVKQARTGYERARARLENGLGSQIEVTEAEFQLRRGQLNYAQMVYNYLTAKANFDLAIGIVPFVDKQE